jgi:hypothetical protein
MLDVLRRPSFFGFNSNRREVVVNYRVCIQGFLDNFDVVDSKTAQSI